MELKLSLEPQILISHIPPPPLKVLKHRCQLPVVPNQHFNGMKAIDFVLLLLKGEVESKIINDAQEMSGKRRVKRDTAGRYLKLICVDICMYKINAIFYLVFNPGKSNEEIPKHQYTTYSCAFES